MTTANTVREHNSTLVNSIVHGSCIQVMRQLPTESVDLILTDPPYLVNFRDRAGRSIANDRDDSWLKPSFAEAFRILKLDRFMICFYGWSRIDSFLLAWREAGFHPVGHLVFAKDYASRTTFLRYQVG